MKLKTSRDSWGMTGVRNHPATPQLYENWNLLRYNAHHPSWCLIFSGMKPVRRPAVRSVDLKIHGSWPCSDLWTTWFKSMVKKGPKSKKHTPWKINMEHNHGGLEVWKIIFLSNWVIFRFHVNLPGCIWSLKVSWYTMTLEFFVDIFICSRVLYKYFHPPIRPLWPKYRLASFSSMGLRRNS